MRSCASVVASRSRGHADLGPFYGTSVAKTDRQEPVPTERLADAQERIPTEIAQERIPTENARERVPTGPFAICYLLFAILPCYSLAAI